MIIKSSVLENRIKNQMDDINGSECFKHALLQYIAENCQGLKMFFGGLYCDNISSNELSEESVQESLEELSCVESSENIDESILIAYFNPIGEQLWILSPVKMALILHKYDLAKSLLDKGYPVDFYDKETGKIREYLAEGRAVYPNSNEKNRMIFDQLGIFDGNKYILIYYPGTTISIMDALVHCGLRDKELVNRLFAKAREYDSQSFTGLSDENGIMLAKWYSIAVLINDYEVLKTLLNRALCFHNYIFNLSKEDTVKMDMKMLELYLKLEEKVIRLCSDNGEKDHLIQEVFESDSGKIGQVIASQICELPTELKIIISSRKRLISVLNNNRRLYTLAIIYCFMEYEQVRQAISNMDYISQASRSECIGILDAYGKNLYEKRTEIDRREYIDEILCGRLITRIGEIDYDSVAMNSMQLYVEAGRVISLQKLMGRKLKIVLGIDVVEVICDYLALEEVRLGERDYDYRDSEDYEYKFLLKIFDRVEFFFEDIFDRVPYEDFIDNYNRMSHKIISSQNVLLTVKAIDSGLAIKDFLETWEDEIFATNNLNYIANVMPRIVAAID